MLGGAFADSAESDKDKDKSSGGGGDKDRDSKDREARDKAAESLRGHIALAQVRLARPPACVSFAVGCFAQLQDCLSPWTCESS